MKLVYIANARIPTEKAHGIQIMKMCEAFASLKSGPTRIKERGNKRGKVEEHKRESASIDVELWVPRRINPIMEDPFKYYGVERSFKIRKFPCLDFVIFDKYIGHLGSWVESVTFTLFLLPAFISTKADIFYTREKFTLPLRIFKGNFYFEAHTFPKNYFLYSFFIKKLKKIVVITEKLKQAFVKKGIAAEKILVAPDGVDIEKFDVQCSIFEVRQKLGLPQDKKIVLYTGHLYKWKGVHALADSAKYLPEEAEIYFVGGTKKDITEFKQYTSNPPQGEASPEARFARPESALGETKEGTSNLHIIGHRPYDEIPYWLKAADVLVLPNSGEHNISKYWTSPMKMFEYMAAGKPIVASNLPSIGEVLNEENALLVESDNPQILAEGIKKVLQDKDFSAKISHQASKDVRQYSWMRRVDKILKFLKR